MKVLSLFDGISCGMVALERVGIKPDTYYASEIDKNAIEISSYNYPEIGQTLGEKCPVGEENEIALTWIKAKGNTRTLEDKAKCLTATGQGISNSGGTNVEIGNKYYTLDPITAERLMTLPDDYTKYGSEGQEIGYAARHKAIGNGWTVDVICEIFKGLNSPV